MCWFKSEIEITDAMEKLDAILSSSSVDAFDLLTSDVEDLKITICADAFITLLQTIAERFASNSIFLDRENMASLL